MAIIYACALCRVQIRILATPQHDLRCGDPIVNGVIYFDYPLPFYGCWQCTWILRLYSSDAIIAGVQLLRHLNERYGPEF